jgi:dTDP-4-amino-4,6-dideoxygalactose transaminase
MIPFNLPSLVGTELDFIAQVLEARKLAGDGNFTRQCHVWLEERLGVPKALLTHSCTAALEMAAILCDLGEGDEVIMPSFTFVSTANAAVLRGAVPVFVDIDPQTNNIDPAAIKAAITLRTRAVFVVHYAGVPCEMDEINAIAEKHGLRVVEDAAQALGSLYKGRPAGALGTIAAFSFHETKNTISGEGGALVLNDPAMIERAEIIREKGTNRSRFFRGEVDKYTWVDIGSSYLPSEILAAFLFAQFQNVDQINSDRLKTWHQYHEAFAELEDLGLVRRPIVPEHIRHNGHIYYLLIEAEKGRDAFIDAMRAAGISPAFHYIPLHSSPAGRRYGRAASNLAATERVAEKLVRLPLYFGMETERNRVIDAVNCYFRT